ncbi:hypothetical protein GAYE_SCF29G4830 [Galdieria yellowstonensis]|uniref:Uncharacterized protein n=1 Tax=Galdieria yellowstonensis TaxID=3028027 RepID=A0AAV9II98_9RHOD|nr:hypothetical protein GAYE_SCF29G4830 [Galdieria yellowstonensis]
MPITSLTIGAMLGKADFAYKYMGGSSIMFNLLKTYIFGKILRTLEYPDGDLYTVKIHYPHLERLKTKIAEVQPPPYPTCVLTGEDIRQLALWHPPAFTEPLRTDRDIRAVPDGAWIFWSKYSEKEFPIPRRGVKLDAPAANIATSSAALADNCISLVKNLYRSKQISTSEYDRLIDLIIEKNEGIYTLARNFSNEPEEFVRHARRQLLKLPEKTIVMSTTTSVDSNGKIASNIS